MLVETSNSIPRSENDCLQKQILRLVLGIAFSELLLDVIRRASVCSPIARCLASQLHSLALPNTQQLVLILNFKTLFIYSTRRVTHPIPRRRTDPHDWSGYHRPIERMSEGNTNHWDGWSRQVEQCGGYTNVLCIWFQSEHIFSQPNRPRPPDVMSEEIQWETQIVSNRKFEYKQSCCGLASIGAWWRCGPFGLSARRFTQTRKRSRGRMLQSVAATIETRFRTIFKPIAYVAGSCFA